MSKLLFPEARKLLTRVVDPECSLHFDPNDKILKMRHKATGKLYDFPALPPAAEEWRNDPKNRALFKAMHTAPHMRGKLPEGVEVPGTTGWVNYAQATTSPCHRFSATQSIPGLPNTTGASMLAYWLGLNLLGGYNYLMQPCAITAGGATVWTLQNWVVDINNNTIQVDTSNPTVSPGASVYPLIVWNGTSAGWNITFSGQTTGLNLTGVTGDGATPMLVKEVHNYSVCTDINPYSGGLTTSLFSSMIIADGSGTNVMSSASWTAYGPCPCSEGVNLTYAASGQIGLLY